MARIYNEKIQEQAAVRYEKGTGELNISGQEEALEEPELTTDGWQTGRAFRWKMPLQRHRQPRSISIMMKILTIPDDEGIMAVIEIPEIQVQLPVYHGTSEDILQRGAGHLKGSSFPVGGDSTHACISAHRGLPGKECSPRWIFFPRGTSSISG